MKTSIGRYRLRLITEYYRECSCGIGYHVGSAVWHGQQRHPWEERWCYE
jgi:hypothetical protein